MRFGGDETACDGGGTNAVFAGGQLDAPVVAQHGGSCGPTSRVDGTQVAGYEQDEARGVEAGARG